MHDLKLGEPILTAQQRDAVHIAVVPVVAIQDLAPGNHFGMSGGGAYYCDAGDAHAIGIVDPFLRLPVKKGQTFWGFLYPGSITSLRHDWTHPAFAEPKDKAVSERWLVDFAGAVGVSYSGLINAVPTWRKIYGDTVGAERLEGVEGFEIPEEFWTHYEIVTGQSVPAERRGSSFSCDC